VATVFISHAGVDTASARLVERWLVEDRHTVRLDRSADGGIPIGDVWRQRLNGWLREADAMVCIVTPAYVASPWCAYEIGAAVTRGCRVLPLAAEDGVVHPLLRALQHEDLQDPDTARHGLRQALRGPDPVGRGWPEGLSPFPGLAPFDLERRSVFCGRTAEAVDLAERLRAMAEGPERLLPVIGPSGCGKSSLVRAGLVPTLACDPSWLIVPAFVPRDDPVGELARALAQVSREVERAADVGAIRAVLDREGIAGIARNLVDAAGPSARHLLVVVDQFEELYPEPGNFLEVLRSAADGPVRVLATLRSEYIDGILEDLRLAVADPVPVRALGREALRQVIEEPARSAGIAVSEELVARLVDDTGDGEALPLLAFTLSELAVGVGWGGELSAERYAAIGGVRGALRRQADAALAQGRRDTGRSRDEVLGALLQLVTVDIDREPTRRRIDMATLPDLVVRELTPFVDRNLLTTERRDDGVVHIAVTHEQFLAAWDPLREVIAGVRPMLAARQQVDAAATAWADTGGPLWTGDQLAAALENVGATITSRSRHARAPRRRLRWAPTAVLAGRIPLGPTAEAFLLASERRDRRQRRRATSVLAALLVITLVAAGVTTVLWRTTRDQQDATTARQLVAQAATVRGTDPAGAVRLELAAAAIFPGDETRSALAAGLTSSRFAGVLTDAPVAQAVFAADGRTMATSATRGGVTLWDLTRGPPVRVGALPVAAGGLAFSPDGRTLAVATAPSYRANPGGGTPDAAVALWDVRDPARPRPAGPTVSLADAGRAQPAPGTWWPGGATALLTFSADGRTLAVAGTVMPAGVAALIDVAELGASRRVGPPLALGATVTAIAFDRSGRALLAGTRRQSDGADVAAGPDTGDVVVWDVTDHAEPRRTPQRIPNAGFAFSTEQGLLAAIHGGSVVLWDLADPFAPRAAATVAARGGTPRVALTRAGTTLAVIDVVTTLARGAQLALYDVAHPDTPRRVATGRVDDGWSGSSSPPAVTFLGGLPAVLVTGSDGRRSVLDYSGGDLRPIGAAVTPTGLASIVATLPDGRTALSGDGLLWDLTDRWLPRRVPLPTAGVDAADLVFSADPPALVVARQNGAVDRIDLADPATVHPVAPAPPHEGPTSARPSVALSPRADRMAVSYTAGPTVTVTDLHDPTHVASLTGPFTAGLPVGGERHVAFLPNGTLVVTSGGISIEAPVELTSWDVTDLDRVRPLGGPVTSTALLGASADATRAVRALRDARAVEAVDLTDPDGPGRLGPPMPFDDAPGFAVALAPDGRVLALSGGVRGGVLWDLADPARPHQLADGLPVAVQAFGFSPDGRSLAVAIADFGARSPYDGTGFAPRGDLQLWDVSFPAKPRALVPGPFGATAGGVGVFSADGRFLATVADGGTVDLWDLGAPLAVRADPRPAACAVAGRGLDRSEWDRYVGSAAYVSTCRSP
jgi:WD40 repeat protein